MLYTTPPSVFKYDVGNMNELNSQIVKWADYQKLPNIELKKVVCGQNAIYQLPDVLKTLGVTREYEILVVMDDVVMMRGEQQVKPLVMSLLAESGYQTRKIVLSGDENGQVHPDFKTIEQVKPHLREKCAVVAVGSGVVTDISKHTCYLWQQEYKGQIPLVSCMTANTVPAYASRSSIISKDGVKRTWPSRLPDAIIMDYKILKDCPLEYTIAGVGDLFPLFCSYADWYLADVLGMANFLDASWRIMDDVKELLIPYSDAIAGQKLEGMEVLSKSLTLCGLAMTYARDSVPVSGYEHVMSHLLDMSAECDGRETGVHGQQVGVSAIWSLAQYELLIQYLDEYAEKLDLNQCYPNDDCVKKRVFSVFEEIDSSGAMGQECWNDIEIKLANWKKARSNTENFLKNWPEHRKVLKKLLPFTAEQCAQALARFGHPLLPGEMKVPVTEQRMRWALKNARFQRKRFTSADLIGFFNLYNQHWEEAVVQKVYNAVEKAEKEKNR